MVQELPRSDSSVGRGRFFLLRLMETKRHTYAVGYSPIYWPAITRRTTIPSPLVRKFPKRTPTAKRIIWQRHAAPLWDRSNLSQDGHHAVGGGVSYHGRLTIEGERLAIDVAFGLALPNSDIVQKPGRTYGRCQIRASLLKVVMARSRTVAGEC